MNFIQSTPSQSLNSIIIKLKSSILSLFCYLARLFKSKIGRKLESIIIQKQDNIKIMSNLDELARSNDSAINAKASCTSNISSSSLIATHTATNATANNLKYICEICGYLIDNNASLKAHLKSHQQSHKSTDVNNNEIDNNDDSEKYKLICYEGCLEEIKTKNSFELIAKRKF